MTLPILRWYQTDVVNRARRRMLTSGRRGIIQGETGCGKGHIIGFLAECAYRKGSRVLILADRRRLVKQLAGIMKSFDIRYGVVMSGESGATLENVILASRDTLVSWHEGSRELPPFDLILIDEAHKSMANTYQAILARYPKAYVVGFTATPCRNDGKSLGDFFQWLECTVPASQLIAEGWLIKPEVYAPLELASKRKKGEGKGLAGDPVSHWRAHADGLPTIGFASKKTEAEALCDRFKRAGIPAECIDGDVDDTPGWNDKTDRDPFYERLASGQTKVLCSIGLLIEGVDIPEASAAILWSSFGSVVKYRQACGRTMRPCPRIGKTRAVILDHAGAAGAHGLPGDDAEWSLDMTSTVDGRREKAIEEGKVKATVVCRGCGLVYNSAPACPDCGRAAPRAERKRTMAEQYEASSDAILERFDGEQAKNLMHEQRQRAWARAIYTAISRQATAGMAAQVFQRMCKLPPWEAGVTPLPSGGWKQPAEQAFPEFVRQRA